LPAGCTAPPAYVGSARPEETVVITALFQLINAVIGLFIWALILAAVFSMLTAFGVLDTRNRLVWTIGDFLYRVTEPILRPVRNAMPSFGNIDLSPIVVILLLQYIARPLLATLYVGLTTGQWSLL
jgi:YggT family protein